MEFTHYDLNFQKQGSIVRVSLQGTECNVLLLDNINFNNYKSGKKYTYYGGHVTQTTYDIPIPYDGNWNVAIDLGGYAGNVRSSVQVIPA